MRRNDAIVMCIFSILAAISVTIFFWYGPSDVHYTITENHAMVGFSLFRYNDIWVDAAIAKHVRKDGLQGSVQILKNIRSSGMVQLEGKRLPFSINDTIGYGVLLGLLWKITGSPSVFDAQLLQMILYVLSL
ncbi:TPA: hypothetical protein ENS27_14115 [bacterium]|nr:hypothetical protein [bacterium]